MDHVETTHVSSQPHETTYKAVAGVSLVEAAGGIAALVLGILGLVGIVPEILAAVAAIAFGVALAVQGGGVAARYGEMTTVDPQTGEKAEIGGGTGAEILGGIGGGVLGLLALIGIAPVVLLACASIVFGASLLLGSASASALKNYVRRATPGSTTVGEQEILEAAAGAEVLVGIAAIALGILALVGIVPMTLVLVAFISLGAAGMIAGSSIGGALMSVFRH